MRTYDIRITGAVTTTAPGIVFVEKATRVYRRGRSLVRKGKIGLTLTARR